MSQFIKQLIAVLANFTSVTETSRVNTSQLLERVLCIYHLLHFQKNLRGIYALIDLSSEVNIITQAYVAKLGLKIQKIEIRAQKIDDFTFNTFKIVLAKL